MPCQYCMRISDHHPSCPNYEPPKPSLYCDVCGEGIYEGDEYITNDDQENAHLDCVSGRELVNFLGYKIKIMEDTNEEY